MEWPLAKAKSEFSILIAKAATEGAQLVTKHGQPAAFVLSPADYKKLTASESFKDFLQAGRLSELSIERADDDARDLPW